MKTFIPPPPPIAAADVKPEWIETRRDVIARFNFPLRAGANNTIEIRSLTPPEQLAAWDPLKLNPWVKFILPDGAMSFVTEADRDLILRQLTASQFATS
ncbi:MAG: hypothetical protein V4773_27635 [Verrucomicrobiota bacterium]